MVFAPPSFPPSLPPYPITMCVGVTMGGTICRGRGAYTHSHTYTYTYTYTYAHIHTCTRRHHSQTRLPSQTSHVCAHPHTHTQTHIYTCITDHHSYALTCGHPYHRRLHAYADTYTHTHTHTHTHAHIYAHICITSPFVCTHMLAPLPSQTLHMLAHVHFRAHLLKSASATTLTALHSFLVQPFHTGPDGYVPEQVQGA